jgi:hypothetical protein
MKIYNNIKRTTKVIIHNPSLRHARKYGEEVTTN